MKNISHTKHQPNTKIIFQEIKQEPLEQETQKTDITQDILNNLKDIDGYLGVGGQMMRADCEPNNDVVGYTKDGENRQQLEFGNRMFRKMKSHIEEMSEKIKNINTIGQSKYSEFYKGQKSIDEKIQSQRNPKEPGNIRKDIQEWNLPDGKISIVKETNTYEGDDNIYREEKVILEKKGLQITIHADGSIDIEQKKQLNHPQRGRNERKLDEHDVNLGHIGYLDGDEFKNYINVINNMVGEIEERSNQTIEKANKDLAQAQRKTVENFTNPSKEQLDTEMEEELNKIEQEKNQK